MHLWHSWKTVFGLDDIAVYQECKCGKRRYVQYAHDDPIEPVNTHWLKTGEVCTEEEKAKHPRPPYSPFDFQT